MIKIAIGVALLLGAIAVGANYIVMSERAKCDARFEAAKANFEKFQTAVIDDIESFATETEKQLTREEKTFADKLKVVMDRHKAAASAKCTLDGSDIADAGSLRDGPRSPAK